MSHNWYKKTARKRPMCVKFHNPSALKVTYCRSAVWCWETRIFTEVITQLHTQ